MNTRKTRPARRAASRTLAVLLLATAAPLALLAVPGVVPFLTDAAGMRAGLARLLTVSLRRELLIASLDVGLLPPRLIPGGLSLRGDAPDGPPFIEAARVEVHLAPRALLARRLEPIAVRVRDAHVRAEGPSPLDLAIETLDLRVDDRAPAASAGDRLPIALDVVLATGGRASVRGTIAPAGAVDIEATIDSVALDPFATWLHLAEGDRGRLGGTVRVEGVLAAPRQITADLVLDDGALTLGRFRAIGRVMAHVDAGADWLLPAGTFDLDASDAEVLQAGGLRKAPGAPARVSGRFAVRDDGTPGVAGLRLGMKRLDLHALPAGPGGFRIEIGPRGRTE